MGVFRDFLHFLNSLIPWESFTDNPFLSRNRPIPSYERRDPYYFYDTPDYADIPQKVWFGVKYGTTIATVWSYFDIFMIQRPPSYMKGAGILFGNLGRIGGTVVLASTATVIVANARGKKDDVWNSVIGFGTTGLIWGFRYKSTGIGTSVAVAMALAGCLLKKHAEGKIGRFNFYDEFHDIKTVNTASGSKHFGNFIYKSDRKDPGRVSLD